MSHAEDSTQEEYRYSAFICCSREDERQAGELQRRLASYHIPKQMQLSAGIRIPPVFRRQEEEAQADRLPDAIIAALRQSRSLIVICSPAGARSRQVTEEIRFFKQHRGSDRIFCLIVGGEPNASDKPELGAQECFPETLRYQVDAAGALTAERMEPIAADLREGKDGKNNACLKLIAGLLGVRYDELRRRDHERQMLNLLVMGGVTLGLLAVMICISAYALFQWKADVRARASIVQGQSRLLLERASELLKEQRPSDALVYLAATVRADPRNQAAVSKTVSLLSEQSFFVPAGPVLITKGWIGYTSFNHDATRVVTATSFGKVHIWDPITGRQLGSTVPYHREVIYAAFGPQDRWLLTVYGDGRTCTWDARSGRPLRTALAAGTTTVEKAEMSPDGRRLLLIDDEGQSVLWYLDPARKQAIGSRLDCGHFSVDGEEIVGLTRDPDVIIASHFGDAVVLIGARTGAMKPEPVSKTITDTTTKTDINFSPDGRHLLLCYMGAIIGETGAFIWDRDRRKTSDDLGSKTTVAIMNGFTQCQFTPDGRYIALTTDDHCYLFDYCTMSRINSLLCANLYRVSFSPDSRYLLTCTRDGWAQAWRLCGGGDLRKNASANLPKNSKIAAAGERLKAPAPAWLPELAEAIGGMRINEKGEVEFLSDQVKAFAAVERKVLQERGSSPYTRWGHWLFSDRQSRTISPFADMTLKQYADQLLNLGTPAALDEALTVAPFSAEAKRRHARLRQ